MAPSSHLPFFHLQLARTSGSVVLRSTTHFSTTTHYRASSTPSAPPPPLHLILGARLVPDIGKKSGPSKHGEDAYFITPSRAFGVADGVGSWILKDIDSGKYSRCLMKAAGDHFALDDSRCDPMSAMIEAEALAKRFPGSCTFCTLALQPHSNELCGLVLGDAGFMVMRHERSEQARGDACASGECTARRLSQDGHWKVVYKSQEQQVRFNTPVAVGTDSSFTSESATSVTIPLRRGDVVLAATDGVFDNLFLNDILQIVERHFKARPFSGCAASIAEQTADADSLAAALTDAAITAAMHPTKRGPFAAQCEKSGYQFEGGKMDDITAVVAIVACSRS